MMTSYKPADDPDDARAERLKFGLVVAFPQLEHGINFCYQDDEGHGMGCYRQTGHDGPHMNIHFHDGVTRCEEVWQRKPFSFEWLEAMAVYGRLVGGGE